MKAQKKLAALPWPEQAPQLAETQHYLVESVLHAPDSVLEIRFYYNRDRCQWGKKRYDFRVFLNPATGQSVVQYRDCLRDWDLGKAMRRELWYADPRGSYTDISKEAEARIAAALGTTTTQNHQLDNLNTWMSERLERDKEARRAAAGYLPDDAVGLCPQALPEALEDFIRTTVLPQDDVLVYKKGNVRGTCFRCGQSVRAAGTRFLQYERSACPNCGEDVRMVLEGGASWSADYVANVAFLQKGTDGETVFIRLFHLVRDPSARFEGLSSWLREAARYAVRGNKAAMWTMEKKESCYIGRSQVYRLSDWTRSSRVYIYDGPYYFAEAGMDEVLAGTRLQYCDFHNYLNQDKGKINPILYLLHYARYPIMEFLWKAGYRKLVAGKVQGLPKEGVTAIRWNAKTVKEAFRFPIRLLKLKQPDAWKMPDLVRLNAVWGMRQSEKDAACAVREPWLAVDTLRAALPYSGLERVARYLGGKRDMQRDFRDYLGECIKLGLDLKDRQVLFPADLRGAHGRTSGLVYYEEHKEEAEGFAVQTKKLEKWSWARGDYFIRPAASALELKEEGAALHHCVASYAPEVAKGKTGIFLVRRAAAPGTPFYTLQLTGKQIVQCRTVHNAPAAKNAEVTAFVEAWLREIVTKKKKGERAA